MEHLLLFCDWTKPIWFGSQVQIIPEENTVSSVHGWLEQLKAAFQNNPNYSKFVFMNVLCIFWAIWKNRNEFIFQNQRPNPMFVKIQADNLIRDLNSIPSKTTPQQLLFPSQKCLWRPPQRGVIKVNCDMGSLPTIPSKAGA